MSLAAIADHMASKGRGPDSMLIHMSPREVQGLQALAMKNGGSLTINPDTGLPEAGFLDKLLPTIIGAGLTFFSGGAINPMMAAGIVGGIQTVRTGDLGKGLAAGLGAYGGAGITQGLTAAGTSALGSQAAGAGAGLTGDMAFNLADAGVSEAGIQSNVTAANQALQQQAAERVAAASPFDKLSAGAKSVAENPMQFANKDNLKYLAAAAGPILADQAVKANMPTTTTKPGMIRPYSYDPYGGTYTAGTPYEAVPTRAAGGGLMGMANNQFNFAQGGDPVVRMADGTPPKMLTDEQLYQNTGSWDAAAAARDAQNKAMNQYTWDQQNQQQKAMNMFRNETAPNLAAQNYVQSITPDMTGTDFVAGANKAGVGLTAPLAAALSNSGLSAGAQYALTHPDEVNGLPGLNQNILKGLATPNLTQAQIDAEQAKYGISDADIQRPFANGYQVDPNQTTTAKQYLADNPDVARYLSSAEGEAYLKAHPEFDASDIAYTHYMRYGKGEGRDWKLPTPITESTSLPGGIGGVNAIVNPNGTVTQGSAIPGATSIDPTTGAVVNNLQDITGLKNLYTTGGGSLGYTPTAPKTIDEFNASFNKLTGGSKAAYDYLMGKTPYSPIPYTPTGEIQKPYWESVGKAPVNLATKKYIFKDGKYELNPAYIKPPYVLAAEKAAAGKETTKTDAAAGKSINVIDAQGNTEQAYLRDDGFYYASGGNKFDEKGVQVVAGGGLMAMARRGMSQQFDLGGYSDGGRLLRGPGDGVSDSIPATIGNKRPARLADGEFVVPARIVSELGNGSTEAGARKLYAMMDRVQAARRGSIGKGKVAKNTRAAKYLPA